MQIYIPTHAGSVLSQLEMSIKHRKLILGSGTGLVWTHFVSDTKAILFITVFRTVFMHTKDI